MTLKILNRKNYCPKKDANVLKELDASPRPSPRGEGAEPFTVKSLSAFQKFFPVQ